MTTETPRTDGALARLARFCYRRRRLVLLTWIVGVVAVAFVGFSYGAASDNDYSGGKSDSAKAQALIEKHFPEQQGDTLTLAIKAERGIDDPAARQKIEKVIAELDASPLTGPVTSPYQDENLVTKDRRIARTTIPLTDKDVPKTEVKPLVDIVKDASGDGVTLGLGGDKAEKAETPPQGPAEGVGLLTAAVILFIAFGSLVAMGLPIVTGLMAVLGGIALMKLVGHLVPSPDFTVLVCSLIGLGVGIDYALFILTRYRDSLRDGDEPESATVKAITTAGHAVLFAGTTVLIALLGLIAMGQAMMAGVAVGASVTVLVTMIAAVTLLPAFLGFIGYKINALRLPRRTSRQAGGDGAATRERRTPAERWAGVVQRRPLIAAILAGASLLVLAAPALSMRLSLPDASVQPHDRSSYTSHRIISEGFGPGYGAPLIFATEVGSTNGDLGPVVEAVRKTEGIAYATPPRISKDGQAAVFMAFPRTGYQDEATADLVHRLRDDVLPKAPGGEQVYLGGPNAGAIDFAEDTSSRLPLMITVVIVLSLLLLVVLVRSVTIALQAAAMNLLSIGAAYGVLVAIVQWGWLGSALGFPTEMPVTTWVPMMMFPLLFGLSMDYEVFLVSRIREEYERTGDTRTAVTRGLAGTAKVITAAAAIMIAIFTTAVLGPDVSVKQIGLGMAVAVLVDATIIRMVLVPAVMELCGKANWWMPGRRALKADPTPPDGVEEPVRV
ncbi:putative drug exporter of the RND superfamily [Micromonospora viridifaciens]|uniref:Putative drug exporter of the RND superfamily n=1 Tax=Micromonospora viridifaciens TaxID=1881 RepID=A0A1C4X4J6_MICVI|nr:MMPL family transporter [Micromonospora viridifaciens]SCF03395.1 putative drug exporter of the RND superfamily [Micromonospora viridifaciens]